MNSNLDNCQYKKYLEGGLKIKIQQTKDKFISTKTDFISF